MKYNIFNKDDVNKRNTLNNLFVVTYKLISKEDMVMDFHIHDCSCLIFTRSASFKVYHCIINITIVSFI